MTSKALVDSQVFEQALRQAPNGMALLTTEGRFLEVNEALCRLLGRDEATLRQLTLTDVTHPDDRAESSQLVAELLAGRREALSFAKRYLHADGQLIWGQVAFSCLRSSGECLLILQIVATREAQRQSAENADEVEIRPGLDPALHADPLTGLPSRNAILQSITAALASGQSPTTTAVLSVGVDHLSQVNHALTHRAGDQLIATVARRLVQALNRSGQVARGTGDTFIVLLDQLASAEEAAGLAERLRLASKGPMRYEGQTIECSVSIGVAIAHREPHAESVSGPTADELLRDASLAMREAAARGRDRCAWAAPHLTAQAQQSLQLLQELRQGLERAELQAWFMPIVNLADGSLRGYEALLRWLRRDGRLEMPDTFLPIARHGQLSEAIDRHVLRRSIAALSELPAPLSVAANLSTETLARPGLVEQVHQWLQQAGVSPGRLHLEITETTLLKLGADVTATIQGLARLGVRWVVDDFGTGFSTISHLRDLPIHGLKLDRSFIEGVRHGDQKCVRLAQALAGLAEGLELDTVAEGIESAEEAISLRDLGWCCGQGWFFGQAAPLSHWQSTPWPALGLPPAPTAAPLVASRRNWALAVTETVPVGLFALRLRDGGQPQLLFASRRLLEMLQMEREQLMVDLSPILERTHPDDRSSLISRWQHHRQTGTPLAWEGRLQIGVDATWMLLEAAPLPQADGSCIWQGVVSDITSRKLQELHLRRILDEAPIAMAIQQLGGADPSITYVNQQFSRCLGYELSTIPCLSDWARLAYPDPQQRNAVYEAWDASVAQARSTDGVVAPLEAEITTADGRVRQALISAVLLGDTEMVISVLDITAWRQAEQELQRARTALAENALAITEGIPVGTYTMVLPAEGGMASFSFMSERFLQICGLQRQEAAADPFKAFACVHPDDYDAWVQRNAEAFAHKQRFAGECRVVVDGKVRWVRAESVPRELTDGSTVWEGVLMDITDQQRALEQLERERALLTTVLSHIDAQVYMKDRQGRYLYANVSTEQLLRHGVESLVGRTDAELMPLEAAKALEKHDEQVFREGGPLWREERLPLPGGQERIFLSKKLLYHQPGQEDCLIGFSTEITELHTASARLAASEEQFRLLAENSSDVVFRVDPQGRIAWVSPSLTTALGWLPQDWIGQVGTRFLLHGGEAEHYKANLQSLLSSGQRVIAREQIYAKDGSIHWIETHAVPYVNGKGLVDGIVASFHLIDEMVAAEETLRLSERRHRRLADQMLDVVWAINLEGKFTYVSPSLLRVRGFTPEELIAMPLEQQFPQASYAVVLEGLRKAREDVAAGRPVFFHEEVEEYCKDGSTVWTDVKATGIYDEHGGFLEIAGVSRDITLRHQLKEELRISEERYRLLAENALDVIWTIEPDGQISYVSPSIQHLRGFSPEEAIAQPLEQIHPPESRCRSLAYFQQLHQDLDAGRTPKPFRGELEYYRRDGTTIWTEVIALPTFNDQGEFDKLLGVSRDISERKHYERRLMEANQQLEQLATTDSLTGICNRRQIEGSIQQAIERSDRYGEPLALILCDIDFFKAINDQLGHPVGDQVLIEFCRRIQQQLRSSDVFGRWGGEEFLILLNQGDQIAAMALAEKLRQLIAGAPFTDAGTVTASFGVAQRQEQESAIDWYQRVDNRVYAAKQAGRNCVVGN
ncbi:PAS domain S-box protein [Cyanobium sp. FGCU-6]|nr:PAS domain S-box protein [Cyanobium sp. FGCU6]